MRKPTMFITAMCVLFLDKFSLELLIIISLPHLHGLFLFCCERGGVLSLVVETWDRGNRLNRSESGQKYPHNKQGQTK